jgi:hypothetical protein
MYGRVFVEVTHDNCFPAGPRLAPETIAIPSSASFTLGVEKEICFD